MMSSDSPVSLITKQMMAAQQRPNARRGPPSGSSKWQHRFDIPHRLDRLKSISTDSLEEYGLPSKGETRLNDHKKQEDFYNVIVERYMRFCAESGGGLELTNLFASLSVSADSTSALEPPAASIVRPVSAHSTATTASTTRESQAPKRNPTVELNLILSAMRKLREAIIATNRRDNFAQRAYIFIIHAAVLVRHFESYHPALLYLLRRIHPHCPLSEPELHEVVGYHILDLACRLNDITGAYAIQVEFGYKDRRVEGVLRALTSDNWVKFWKLRRAVDGYQAKLLEYAEGPMRLHVLKCLGRSYMNADKAFVERSTESAWDELVKQGVGWQLDESLNLIIIRKPKMK